MNCIVLAVCLSLDVHARGSLTRVKVRAACCVIRSTIVSNRDRLQVPLDMTSRGDVTSGFHLFVQCRATEYEAGQ